MKVRRRGDWLIATVGDEVVMMSRQKVHHIGITEVRRPDLGADRGAAGDRCGVRAIAQGNDIPPDVCRAEVEAFLNELADQGAVTLTGPRPHK